MRGARLRALRGIPESPSSFAFCLARPGAQVRAFFPEPVVTGEVYRSTLYDQVDGILRLRTETFGKQATVVVVPRRAEEAEPSAKQT